MAETRNIDVFISYAHGDEPWASEFVNELKAQGVRTWWDHDIALGERLTESMEEALREAPILAVLVTPNYISNSSSAFELGAAVAGNKKIIPIVRQKEQQHMLPRFLRDWQPLQESSPKIAGKHVAQVVENLPQFGVTGKVF